MRSHTAQHLRRLLVGVVAGCALGLTQAEAPRAIPAPFLIAPMIEGLGYCAEGARAPTIAQAHAHCAAQANPSAAPLRQLLDALEPGGAHGAVHLGYTVGINLLGFARSADFQAHLRRLQALIDTVQRPVVLYLMGNHFAEPAADGAPDAASLMRFADQSIPKDNYFYSSIRPWTLRQSPDLWIVQRRRQALAALGSWYQELPATLRQRIVAMTLAGELHQLYPDFAHGLGQFDAVRLTDYSPGTVADFQAWLSERYQGRIDALNRAWTTAWPNFSAIQPPSKDLHRQALQHITDHLDSHAHGTLIVEGWLASLPAGHQVELRLNGRWLGVADYGLSRQDVYEAVPAVRDASVGFRYGLDFSHLPRGIHTLQVVLRGPKTAYELARRRLVVMGQTQNPVAAFTTPSDLPAPPKDLQFWLDRPRDQQDLYFNPAAKDWYAFRQHQVRQALIAWFDDARAVGLPAAKLYSHQIASAMVGGWNPLLTASDSSLHGPTPYRKGVNLYGGALNMALLRQRYLGPGESFAVPEFHTQSWKDPQAPLRTLQALRQARADFVVPYFMTLYPDALIAKNNPHDAFRIAPDNPRYGSNRLYAAIRELVRQ
ncbi:MAG: hypothetical protein OHK0048_03880 [Rhodoferax sp.]